MRSIYGRTVCETIGELTDPRSSALILVDMQNDYLTAGGVDCSRALASKASSACSMRSPHPCSTVG